MLGALFADREREADAPPEHDGQPLDDPWYEDRSGRNSAAESSRPADLRPLLSNAQDMLIIDGHLLQEIGLGDLEGGQLESALAHIRRLLDLRFGLRLAEVLTTRQLERFLTDAQRRGTVRASAELLKAHPEGVALLYAEARSLRRDLDGLADAIREQATHGGPDSYLPSSQ